MAKRERLYQLYCENRGSNEHIRLCWEILINLAVDALCQKKRRGELS